MSKISILFVFWTLVLSACVNSGTNNGQPTLVGEGLPRFTQEPTIALVPSKPSAPTAMNPGEGSNNKCVQLKLTISECANIGTHDYSSVLTAVGNCGWKNLNLTIAETTDFSEGSVFINAYEMKKTGLNTYSYSLVNSAGTLEAGTITYSDTGFVYDQKIETKAENYVIHGEYTRMNTKH